MQNLKFSFMYKLYYYILILSVISFASCEKDDSRTESPKEEVSEEVWDEEAVDISLPEVVFTEPEKIASGVSSNIIRDRMIELVDATPENATIHISVYAFHDFSYFFNALERADSRNVNLNIMVDMSEHDQNTIENNQAYVNEMRKFENATVVTVNNTAGAIAINHNKFILFSEILTADGIVENVVHQSSHNFTDYDTRRIQDAVTIASEGLYGAYLNYWEDMRRLAQQGMENYEYREYNDPDAGITAFFYPRRNGGVIGDDNIISILQDITDPSNTSIKIGMSGWSASRTSIIDQLEQLHDQGARIEIITKSNIASSVQSELSRFADKGAYVQILDMSQGINIHSKFMIIEGVWKGEDTNLVLMGSQNFTNNAYKYNNETSLLFQDHEFFPHYEAYFEKLKPLPSICCEKDESEGEEEEEVYNHHAVEGFDSYDLETEPLDLDGLGDSSNGWGGPWEKHSGNFLLVEGNLPANDSEDGKHAVTQNAGDDVNIQYYRPLAGIWENTADTSYWLGFQYSPITEGSWSGLGLHLNDDELMLVGTPYNSGQQGVAGIEGPNILIEGSEATDNTWFVVKMEMSGADGIPHLYIWRNPDPNSEPDINEADISVEWPNGANGFNRLRIGNTWSDGASIAYDHIRLSTDWSDIPFSK